MDRIFNNSLQHYILVRYQVRYTHIRQN